jgi:hypothetical protein
VTAALSGGEKDTPPQWVARDTLVVCIIFAARLNHRIELDEASARQLIHRVMDALVSDPDNTLDSRRPFACRADDGRLGEIGFLADYRIDLETWALMRVEQRLWGDQPILVPAGWLEVSWYKFEQAVAQALREAGPLPVAGADPAVAQAVDQADPDAPGAPPAHYEPVTDSAADRLQAPDVEGKRPLLRIHLDAGEVLESPPDWPQLPQPTPCEPIAAYMKRVITGDSFFQAIERLCAAVGLKALSVGGVRPAGRTLERWRDRYPKGDLSLSWAVFQEQRRAELIELRGQVWERLMATFFERLRAKDFDADGERIDLVLEDRSPVPAGLWGNPDMVLRPLLGVLRPEPRPEPHPPPGSQLPSFIKVKLSRAATAETKSDSLQGRLTAALISLHEAQSLDIRPRVVRVDTLHQAVTKETGISASKSIFEKALKDARDELRRRHSVKDPSEGT